MVQKNVNYKKLNIYFTVKFKIKVTNGEMYSFHRLKFN